MCLPAGASITLTKQTGRGVESASLGGQRLEVRPRLWRVGLRLVRDAPYHHAWVGLVPGYEAPQRR